jgi:hypothetical protein
VEHIRQTYREGRRIRFLEFGEPDPSNLTPGTEGTVSHVDDLGTVHVLWDNGFRLGVVVRGGMGRPPDRVLLL